MSKHRLEPPPRVRPRIGRLVAASVALVVTGVALLSGIGVINLDAGPARASSLPTGSPSSTGNGMRVSMPRSVSRRPELIQISKSSRPWLGAVCTKPVPASSVTCSPSSSGTSNS